MYILDLDGHLPKLATGTISCMSDAIPINDDTAHGVEYAGVYSGPRLPTLLDPETRNRDRSFICYVTLCD